MQPGEGGLWGNSSVSFPITREELFLFVYHVHVHGHVLEKILCVTVCRCLLSKGGLVFGKRRGREEGRKADFVRMGWGIFS